MHLEGAIAGYREEPEHVHQMRVSSRRCRSALRLLELLLPHKLSRWFRKRLRSIQRASGAARDVDVMIHRIGRRISVFDPQWGVARAELLLQLSAQRDLDQQAIEKLHHDLRERDFPRHIDRIIRKIRWRGTDGEPFWHDYVEPRLQMIAQQMFEAGEQLEDSEQLHAFRISGKHFRYALELAGNCLPTRPRNRLYNSLRRLQDRLGTINDCVTSQLRLADWLAKLQATEDHQRRLLLHLIEEEQHREESQTQLFHQWWTDDRATKFRQLWDDVQRG